MQLVIFATNRQQVINLHKEFFTPTKVRNGNKTEIVLPSKKARDLALDFYGNNLVAWELSKDNRVVDSFNMNKVRPNIDELPKENKPAPEVDFAAA